ncbi:unnamed protein product [Caenorhabditis brenneri]
MSITSMSLENLHFLLQHMEANRRFEIYNRCPSLREFEKSVPLKINSLVLSENCVVVNDTTYKLGIIQKCYVGETPQHVAARNEIGGAEYELDAYGIIDESDSRTVTPGDVTVIQNEEPFMHDDDLYMRGLEQIIQIFEENLAGQRERRPRGNREAVDRIEKTIEGARAKLFDYQRRRENIPSRYENFFQLTKSPTVDMQEQKTFERYKHNKKFSEGMKQMATKLFGGRSSPINVKKLTFDCGMGAIRLPVGLRLHIEQLMFCTISQATLEALAPILHESSFPLKKLGIAVLSVNDATNPMVNTAEKLRIGHFHQNDLQTILSMTNPVIHVDMLKLPEETIERLIAIWIASNHPIGIERIFSFFRAPIFASEVEEILKKLNGTPVDDETVTISMSAATQLKVSYGPFPEFAPRAKWAFRFLTEAIEH